MAAEGAKNIVPISSDVAVSLAEQGADQLCEERLANTLEANEDERNSPGRFRMLHKVREPRTDPVEVINVLVADDHIYEAQKLLEGALLVHSLRLLGDSLPPFPRVVERLDALAEKGSRWVAGVEHKPIKIVAQIGAQIDLGSFLHLAGPGRTVWIKS